MNAALDTLTDCPEFAGDAHLALLELGATGEEVAARLAALGVKGHQEEVDDCPVFHYPTARNLSVAEVHPGSRGHIGGDDPKPVRGWVAFSMFPTVTGQHMPRDVQLPPAVDDFVQRFDRGDFPKLVAA